MAENESFDNQSNPNISTPKRVARKLFAITPVNFSSPANQIIPINKSYKNIAKDLAGEKFKKFMEKTDLFLSRIPYDSMTKMPKIFLGAIFFSIFSLLGKDAKPLVLLGKKYPRMVIQGYTTSNKEKVFVVFSFGKYDDTLKIVKENKKNNIKSNALPEENKTFCISFKPGVSEDEFAYNTCKKSNINDCFFSSVTLPEIALYDHQDPFHAFLTEIEKNDDFNSGACEKILYNIYSNLIDNGFSMQYENFFQLVLVTMLSFVYDDIKWEEKCLGGRSDAVLLPNDKRKETIIFEFKFRDWKKDTTLATNELEKALNQIEDQYAKFYSKNGPVSMIAIVVVLSENKDNFSVSVSRKEQYKPKDIKIEEEAEFLF